MTAVPVLTCDHAVTLIGGGPVPPALLDRVAALAPVLAAADGGADTLLQAGRVPRAVIGDFDSLSAAARAQVPEASLHHVPEQDSTDFEKCLTRIDAPLILALGFAGGRMDHLLAVFNVLVRHPGRPVIVVGAEDVCVLLPPAIALDLTPGTPVSLFPMGAVSARSHGLHWPLDGLSLAPDGRSGTSNHATGPVRLMPDAPKLLLLLPLSGLEGLIAALKQAPGWS